MANVRNFIKKALTVPANELQTKDLIHYEAKLGGELFGPIPPKHRREFFCLDEHTWVWHEEWLDKSGRRQSLTTRYDVRPNGIFKVQGNSQHHRLSSEELRNFHEAVQLYSKKVGTELQRIMNQS